MKGDITRKTFKKERHYRKVNFQQGRVTLDADLNELVDIQNQREQSYLADIIGQSGTSVKDDGFRVITGNIDNKSLKYTYIIQKGRYYVDGILCENEKNVLAFEQPDYPDIPPDHKQQNSYSNNTNITSLAIPTEEGRYIAYLNVWERDLTYLDDPAIREMALGGPDTATRSKVIWQVKLLKIEDDRKGEDANDTESYLEGEKYCSYRRLIERIYENEFFINTGVTETESGNLQVRFKDGKVLKVQAGTLQIQFGPLASSGQSTLAGYTGIQNQIYRVEIHQVETSPSVNGITKNKKNNNIRSFKWSRDNASFVTKLIFLDVKNNRLVLDATKQGKTLNTFKVGAWVEITNDCYELNNIPGIMLLVKEVQILENNYVLTFDAEPNTGAQANVVSTKTISDFLIDKRFNPKVRKWDGFLTYDDSGKDDTINLELGIGIRFGKTYEDDLFYVYKVGDYWLIPARSLTKGIEWPTDEENNNSPLHMPSLDLGHHFSPIALLEYKLEDQWKEAWSLNWQSLLKGGSNEEKEKLSIFIKHLGIGDFDPKALSLREVSSGNGEADKVRISGSVGSDFLTIEKKSDRSYVMKVNDCRTVYGFITDDNGNLARGKISVSNDCRKHFSPATSTNISYTVNTGIIILHKEDMTLGHKLFGPMEHSLRNLSVPPAIILGVDSHDQLARISVTFMEDYVHSKLHFKAIAIDLRNFYISLEGTDVDDVMKSLEDNNLRLRWWAIPAQDKEEQVGYPVTEKDERRSLFGLR